MSIISFRCHTTIHLAPLVNQETIHQDMDRGQQLMSRINQGILREIKPKNPLVEWYYRKDKHTDICHSCPATASLFCGHPHISDFVTRTEAHGNASAESSIAFLLVILPGSGEPAGAWRL